ncbi:GNAT family N-acetyltransferase [Myroides sp. WP-1]|uniref:GNAT family N-acetyltransferase n=1 Tax=Myroides sp. WP-1 TaxID=2759944 RepID=UPI0015FA1EE8|nr:GNAT family protein [Myroides sp. WP-1]MBB1140434.1 GNAT family N-acetyltransferase [Myroides sp. WP-1]
MIRLETDTIYLRALEPEDLEFIYQIENDVSLWEVSNTQTPYSRFLIHQYLENAHLDIYEAKQLRLVICAKETNETLGLIDLFDFDPKNSRAGVGIVIQNDENRAQGIGAQALELVLNYSREYLYLNQLYANIASDNQASIRLFAKFNFQQIGIKKAWTKVGQTFKDEIMYQLIF